MTDTTQSNKGWILRNLNLSKEILATIIGISAAIVTILTQVKDLGDFIDKKSVLIGIDILNIIILAIALFSIKAVKLNIHAKEYVSLKKLLIFSSKEKPEDILERVNNIVKQLVDCIFWFLIILGIFYALQCLMDITTEYETFKEVIKASKSILHLLSYENSHCLNAAKYTTLEFFTNSTNLFSAAYLILAFQVLFLVTLENDNKTWKLKKSIPFAIAVIITIANAVFFAAGFLNVDLASISHIMRLIGGIYNGVAMFLLFSRFIAMEFFFQNSKNNWQKNFYFFGIVFILPMYVVAQPLYGLFNALEVTISAEIFKTIVFLVCFWGKLVFVLFLYTMLTKKWIHSYLFLVLSQKDSLTQISLELADVDDLIDSPINSSLNDSKKHLE